MVDQAPQRQAPLAAVGALVVVAVGVLTNLATSNPAGWLIVALGVAVGAYVLIEWMRARPPRARPAEASGVPPVPPGAVARAELDLIVDALIRDGAGTVGITTTLYGAGGFGKTTLAVQACHHPYVLARFGDRIEWVTLGRDAKGAEIAQLINDMATRISGERRPLSDLEQAGFQLKKVLKERAGATLLVVDDVWDADQLRPFLSAVDFKGGRLLVTTRQPEVLPSGAEPVRVDQMGLTAARTLLTRDVGELSPPLVDALLRLTGRWPMLLSVANRALRFAADRGGDVDTAAGRLIERLRADGPTGLDVETSAGRTTAVRAFIENSLGLLTPDHRQRFLELSVFAEDAEIPIDMAWMLWNATGRLTEADAAALCEELYRLSLLSNLHADPAWITLHDVFRSYAGRTVGEKRLIALHRTLLDAAAARHGLTSPDGTEWWRLPPEATYMWRYLAYHLQEAQRQEDLDRLVADLRWVDVKIRLLGPSAAEADLARSSGGPLVNALSETIAQEAHLLSPLEPAHALTVTLLSRLRGIPEFAAQAAALEARTDRALLTPRWPLPDEPDPLLRRTLVGHTDWIRCVAISPDGTWLATASDDSKVGIWSADGRLLRVLTGHRDWVRAVAISPDGTWLATAADDRTVRLWDLDGAPRGVLRGHADTVCSVSISPDGTWLASAGKEGSVRLWRPDGTPIRRIRPLWLRRVLGLSGLISDLAITPDGEALLLRTDDKVAWIQPRTAKPRVRFEKVEVAAFGRRGDLVTVGGESRWWEPGLGRFTALQDPPGEPTAVVVCPQGRFAAVADLEGRVQIYGPDGKRRHTIEAHGDAVRGMAISSDGTWLVTASEDGTARIWTAPFIWTTIGPAGTRRAASAGDRPARLHDVAVTPDGGRVLAVGLDGDMWVFTGDGTSLRHVREPRWRESVIDGWGNYFASRDRDTIGLWDLDGEQIGVISGHEGRINNADIAPDGKWVMTAGQDGTVRRWLISGHARGTYHGSSPATDIAIAPNERLAAVFESGDLGFWELHGRFVESFAPEFPYAFPRPRLRDRVAGRDLLPWRLRRALADWRGEYRSARRLDIVRSASDGSWLVVGALHTTRMVVCVFGTWPDLKLVLRLRLPGTISGEPAISQDGRLLSVPTSMGVFLWSRGENTARVLTSEAEMATFSPSGRWIAATERQILRVWDTATGKCVVAIRVDGDLASCAWFPDESGLCAAGARGLYGFSFRPGGRRGPGPAGPG